MKIKRLSIAGFGPYKTLQQVDFERFDDDGIFLIEGPTGAGKSSILDAVCFALYGGVPRYDGSQQQLRSDYCAPEDPTFVELEFTAKDVDYRLRRSPEYERPQKPPRTGTTKQAAAAQLDVFQPTTAGDGGGEWVGVAARPVDVATLLDGVLGLSKDQFLQVILLAQNRFQRFLHAKVDERQALLRTLFGTRRFDDIETALIERRKALAATVDASLKAIALQAGLIAAEPPEETDRAWFDEVLDAVVQEHSASLAAAKLADAAHLSADGLHRQAETTLARQSRRDSAAARLEELAAEAPEIELERGRLASAGRAELVWAHVVADEAAQTVLADAQKAESRATAAHEEFAAAVLPAAELIGLLGSLDAVLADEQALPKLRVELDALEANAAAQALALDAAALRITALPAELEALALQRAGHEARAAGETGAREQVTRTTGARAAAVRAESLAAKHETAAAAEVAASGKQLEAATLLDELLGQRLRGHAAELASELVEGEPCAVCGSANHPEPTQYDGQPVSEADVTAARAALASARKLFDAAGALEREISTNLTEQVALAGGKSTAELSLELSGAETTLAEAVSARELATGLVTQQAALKTELAAGTATLEALRAGQETAGAVLVARTTEVNGLIARVEAQLGGFPRVHDRVLRLKAQLAAVQLLDVATAERGRSAVAAGLAATTLKTHVDGQGFPDAGAAVAARLTPVALASSDARVRSHDQSVVTAQSTLADPELSALALEPIELAATAEVLQLAREARDLAISAASTLGARTSTVRGVVERAGALIAASEAVHREYTALRQLADVVEGKSPNTKRMRLETYVLAAQLEEIILAANARLRTMTSGRYSLEHDDSVQFRNTSSGLGIAIFDEHTGRVRQAHSLSGGETFLASLALALGLAEVVSNQSGGIKLDTLFIDEGFGSLDSDTLAIAMSTLDGLRSGGRTIGLISHVETMKEQIPARLHIEVSPQGWSEIS
jgi:exonuclease SbcC